MRNSLAAIAVVAVAFGACGGPGKPPRRGVIEHNVSAWSFRRYQAVLDVEVWVPRNRAAAHTASYVRKDAEKLGRINDGDICNVFVTRYKNDVGIDRALVKFARRLAQENGYSVEEKKLGGARLLLIKGRGETWAMWSAKRHVIKIGGRSLPSVPEGVIEEYADRYPSRIKAGVLDNPLPVGPDPEPEKKQPDEFDPESPRPEWKD